ncbi:NAD-binding protein [uncultured Nocardioides sp.]|uniref:NAD-binding protein n=1 Tax=uncultured Nocardioides sp. TaxID=198441 RepID=UPI00262EAE34|nr:NAD-binding protein [uncultured Nocardioides sp.]
MLGYVGYRDLADASMSRTDAAFGAIQLFFMETQTDLDDPPVALNIARFTAPLSLAAATLAAVLAVAGQQIRRALVRWRGRDHVVLVGLSETGTELARALRERDQRVVVLEADPAHPSLAEVQSRGAVVVTGDARQPGLLRRCRVDTAQQVVVTTGSDSANVEVCEALTHLVSDDTTVHAAIDDESLWSVLGRVQIEETSDTGSFDFFHADDRKALAFIDIVDRSLGATASAVYFSAEGALAQRVLIRWCQRRLAEGTSGTVHVSSATYAAVVDPLLATQPWLTSVVSTDATAPTTCTVGLVCREGSDGRALSTALEIAGERHVSDVFVCSTLPTGRAVLDLKGVSEKIHLVPAGSAFREPDSFFGHSWIELMATARHEDYCATERLRGITSADNSSLVSWDELPESLKDSNRRFAVAVGSVLGEIGAGLVPLSAPPESTAMPVSTERLETLARQEHDRWMDDLVRDGWTYSSGPKDPERKTHPLLVGWDELDEPEREKDRDAIRAIPRMLARVGYALDVPATC